MYVMFFNGEKHNFNNHSYKAIMDYANSALSVNDEAILLFEDNFDVCHAYQLTKMDENLIIVRTMF